MMLKGIHHVSGYTSNAKINYSFYTKVLGMRFVKKTVNQDTPSMYHLFYGDEEGNPGTELTFFEIPMIGSTYRGTNSISKTSLRVPSNKSLMYWQTRFDEFGVTYKEMCDKTGHQVVSFEDHEGQRLSLVSDERNQGVQGGKPWGKGPVPTEHGISGLGPITLTVRDADKTTEVLVDILGFRKVREYASDVEGHPDIEVFEVGEGGNGSEIHLEERNDLEMERPGRGSVHHVAFRVNNIEEMQEWAEKINREGLDNSGIIDRYYFQSIYITDPNGLIFELATDGPGFTIDEHIDHLGEKLALPPRLESQSEQIEQRLKPIN